jgi:hypothetical protein
MCFGGYRLYVYNITYIRKQNMNELIGNCKALKNYYILLIIILTSISNIHIRI